MKRKINKVDIKFGYSCNNNCIHCVVAGHKERLKENNLSIDRTTKEIKKIISEVKERGANSLVFTGGEVTIREDFLDLLKYTKNLDLIIGLQTNGRMFHKKSFVKKTLKIAPDMHFEIALHSDKEENHDKITKTKGSWKQTIEGIKNLKRNGVTKLNLKIVISRLNYKDLVGIVELSDKLNVKQIDIAFPHGMGNALRNWQDVIPKYNEIMEYILKAIELANEKDIFISLEAVPFCFLVGFERHVSELRYLHDSLEGNISELMQIGDPTCDWHKVRCNIKNKTIDCKDCKYFYICEGVWEEYIELHGSKELKPVKGKKIRTKADLQDIIKKSK